MKPIVISVVSTVVAGLLTGCGPSASDTTDASKAVPAAPAPPTASAPASAPAPQTETSANPAVATTPTEAKSSPATVTPIPQPDTGASTQDPVAGPAAQLAAAQTDTQAASIANELSSKAKSLATSAGGNSDLKSKVGSALQSLSAGKDSSALGTLFQEAKQANLTPQQTQLVKDVGNLASAYVVQKNFSSLDGAQGDVANIVNALRKGSITPALPALQSLAQNASLTPQQKDLVGTLADQYAPGLKKAGDSLKQGLQGLQGLTK